MKPLFKVLLNQAGLDIKHGGIILIDNVDPEEALEQFAILIVKECELIVEDNYDDTEPWMQPGDLFDWFGIEE
jgi:hypothetical protein